MELEFGVSSDVVHGGYDETGYPLERLVYYLISETPTGRRFAHFKSFAHEREAEALLVRVQYAYSHGRSINPDCWREIDPAYGSEAYQQLDDEKFFRNREIEEAMDKGEINEYEANRLMMM